MYRRGVTLIELLIVIVIIGLLASIALPRLQGARRRAQVATMRSDLRGFALHQESYYYDFTTFTDDLVQLSGRGFRTTADVTITVNEATILGWSATATHTAVPTQCYVFVGDAAPVGTATVEGSVDCS